MRTTLEIDDDLLDAAKELARREGVSAGAVVSRLLRQALTGAVAQTAPVATGQAVAGFLPFPARPGVVVTQDHVNALRDQEGI